MDRGKMEDDKMITYKDCQYRYQKQERIYCKNKQKQEDDDGTCDNCKQNIHLNCTNYNPHKDYCLKYFQDNITNLKECKEKTTYNDNNLQRKWSN